MTWRKPFVANAEKTGTKKPARWAGRRVREVQPILWRSRELVLLDQRKLPARETFVTLTGARDTARAIRDMVVRGAPAIGVTAAFGMVMEARRFRAGRVREDFDRAAAVLAAARPTAVNLVWALERLRSVVEALPESATPRAAERALEAAARRMMDEDIRVNRSIGEHGGRLLRRCRAVLTHCNAGALATAGYGTAVGVIRNAWENGTELRAYAGETRPFLQGARLTSWELVKLGIPTTLITDGMVGHLFQTGDVGAVVVGTDRTAANGDVANKIGTYQIAALAARHGIPFYVAAPTSSIDLACAEGRLIPIEQRPEREVTHVGNKRIAAEGVEVFNPAFDVTPAELVTAIITEEGVVRGNYGTGLARMVRKAERRRRAE